MDYFQGVVTEYLRANRATFVNTECCIQLNPGANPDCSGPHWYCDALAVNLQHREAFLCEISYSKTLDALSKRLASWAEHWASLRTALHRDCGIPVEWPVKPWIFIPSHLFGVLEQRLAVAGSGDKLGQMPRPKITALEEVLPWKYKSWNREHITERDA